MARAPKTPEISVIERRLQSPNVFRQSSQPIPLTQPGWTVRWENSEISPDHLYDLQYSKGWQYADPALLACSPEEIGARVQDGRIVRGVRGAEVLMQMRTDDYQRIQESKTRENIRQTFGTAQTKAAIVAGVGAAHGDQAAEFVARNVNAITVTDSRERVSADE